MYFSIHHAQNDDDDDNDDNNNNNNNPWSKILLEKLTVSQLVKTFPSFYGTRKFVTAFTSARQLSLS